MRFTWNKIRHFFFLFCLHPVQTILFSGQSSIQCKIPYFHRQDLFCLNTVLKITGGLNFGQQSGTSITKIETCCKAFLQSQCPTISDSNSKVEVLILRIFKFRQAGFYVNCVCLNEWYLSFLLLLAKIKYQKAQLLKLKVKKLGRSSGIQFCIPKC